MFDDIFDIDDNGKYDIVDQIAIEDSTEGSNSGKSKDDTSYEVEVQVPPYCPKCGAVTKMVFKKDIVYSVCTNCRCDYKLRIG